jgi:glyoxylase-like metal-dependent hydrolase (beta-lactamase superfamily II)
MLELQRKTLGVYQTNCYVLIDSGTNEAILVDAPAEAETILSWLAPLNIQRIVLTHGHSDHVGALEKVRQALDVPVALHLADSKQFKIEAEMALEHGDKLRLGDRLLQIAHIPGHTPGSVAIKVLDDQKFDFAIVGDTIFPGGPGHTTSAQALRQSLDALERTVFTWPDHVALHPGHGSATTVGEEREPFKAFRKKTLPPDLFGDVLWR